MMPVAACTMNTASVALPSVCHHVRPPGILRSRSALRMPARSMRSSTHFESRFIALRLYLVGDAEPVVAVVHEHRAVANLDLQLVEGTRRRSGEDFTRLDVELPTMARAEEVFQILVVDVAAAEMGAVPVVCLELVAVLRVQPHAVERAALDPGVLLRLHEVHPDRHAHVEQRDVVGDFHPAVHARLRKARRDERANDWKSDEQCAHRGPRGAYLRETSSPAFIRARGFSAHFNVVIHGEQFRFCDPSMASGLTLNFCKTLPDTARTRPTRSAFSLPAFVRFP